MNYGFSQVTGDFTLNLSNATMEEFVENIERNSTYRFIYRTKDIAPDFSISLNEENKTIEELLNIIFKESKITYNIIDNEIFLSSSREELKTEGSITSKTTDEVSELIVTGRITDTKGVPLLGANVIEKGTKNGTVSDENGLFELKLLNPDRILIISYVGFQNQEIKTAGQDFIDISLKSDSSQLNEVVVVGYGTQRKADVTGAVGSISNAQITSRPITSPDQALAGAVAGLNISTWSGDAGAPINVRIRGTGTVGSNTPLWVVDGVPLVQTANLIVNTTSSAQSNPLAGINANDIESIDVLKDAASAAIYGARAANGVIIVTTKRGKGSEPKFRYDGYGALAQVTNRRSVLNVPQYIEVQRRLGRDFSNFSELPFIDWQDAVNRESFAQNHNLSVNGGGEKANYFISGSYLQQSGVEIAQNFERYTLRVNSDFSLGKAFTFGQSLLLSQFDRDIQSERLAFASFNAALNAPFFPIFQENSPLFGFAQESDANLNGNSGRATGQNIVARGDPRVEILNVKARKVLSNFYGQIQLGKTLHFRSSVGIDYTTGGGDRNLNAIPLNGTDIDQDLSVQSRLSELSLTTGATLTYNEVFGNHGISALIGFEQTKFRFERFRLQGSGLTIPNVPTSGTTLSVANAADQWTIQGWLGRINYNYLGKYFLTANVRRDATSRFGPGFRSGIFPSISAGWKISEEDFFNKKGPVDKLKLRVSWGQNGNQDIEDSFSFLDRLNNNIFYVVGDDQNVVNAPAPIQFSNPSLTWETISQLDLGVDIAMFNKKLGLTIDYYNKESKDVILGLPLPFTSGFFLPAPANIGSIRNSGFEFSVDYKNSIGDFSYAIAGNLTTVKNIVSDLDSRGQIISGVGGQETHRTIVGQSLGHFYGYKTNGLYQNLTETNTALPDALSSGPEPGDIRFVDVNGDGRVNADDRTVIGSPIPGFFYGINLSGNYRKWDFSAVLRGVGDVQLYNQARRGLESFTGTLLIGGTIADGTNNFSTSVLNSWSSEGSTNSSLRPRIVSGDPNRNERFSDRWIEDAGFLRIQNIQLGYSLDSETLQQWTNNLLSQMRIYAGITNLATFTKYDGPDPDVTRARSFQGGDFTLATGQDSGITPEPTLIQLGLSLTF